MLAAEFGYSTDHIDWQMDIDDLITCYRYRKDNPPVGTLLKAFLFDGDQQNIKPEVSNSLEDFIADFTGAGGETR